MTEFLRKLTEMNDFTIIAVSIILGALGFVAVPKNKLYAERGVARRLLSASLGTLFLAGAVLVFGTRLLFSLPHEQRNHLFLFGVGLLVSPIVIGYLADRLSRP